MPGEPNILEHLLQRFGADSVQPQKTTDDMLTLWVSKENICSIIRHLKSSSFAFHFLYDLCGMDERNRKTRKEMPVADFTVVYHLFSYHLNSFIRLKVA